MEHIYHIRYEYFEKGKSIREIAKSTGHDRETIKKYLEQEDFSLPKPVVRKRISKTDPFRDKVRGWLESDEHAPRKQRHTAHRIYNLLVKEENELGDENDGESSYRGWIPAPEDVDEEEEEEEPAPKKQKPGRVTKKSIVEDSLEEGATILEMAERIVAAGIDANLEKNIKTVKLWLRKMGFDTKKEFIETNPVFKNSMKREGN